jgi:adenosylcobinamide-phosphate synthase
VRGIGFVTALGERFALRAASGDAGSETIAGGALACGTVAGAASCSAALLASARHALGTRALAVLETVLAASTLATRDLLVEADAVLAALACDDLELARQRLARTVGREAEDLCHSEIARAAIETLAESVCDGIVAPLCALAAGGVPFAFAFKAASTLDSMIGHIEAPYTHLGRCTATMDDVLCFVPARLTALAICLLAPLAGGSSAAAWRTLVADGGRHRSPNAGLKPRWRVRSAFGSAERTSTAESCITANCWERSFPLRQAAMRVRRGWLS